MESHEFGTDVYGLIMVGALGYGSGFLFEQPKCRAMMLLYVSLEIPPGAKLPAACQSWRESPSEERLRDPAFVGHERFSNDA